MTTTVGIGLEGRVDESPRILMRPIRRLWHKALPGIPLRGLERVIWACWRPVQAQL
jgi:hypothetical protein